MFSECTRLFAKSYGSFTTSLTCFENCFIVYDPLTPYLQCCKFDLNTPYAQYRIRIAIQRNHLKKSIVRYAINWRTRLVKANQVKRKLETHVRLSPLGVHNKDPGAASQALLTCVRLRLQRRLSGDCSSQKRFR